MGGVFLFLLQKYFSVYCSTLYYGRSVTALPDKGWRRPLKCHFSIRNFPPKALYLTANLRKVTYEFPCTCVYMCVYGIYVCVLLVRVRALPAYIVRGVQVLYSLFVVIQ